jgi:hypothetical protein
MTPEFHDSRCANIVGLDLGQAQDFTALAVLRRPVVRPGAPLSASRPVYQVPHLQRFQLGTPYPEIVKAVVELMKSPALQTPVGKGGPPPFLVVDQTGVGRPVVNLFEDALRNKVTCRMAAVTITAGHGATLTPTGGLCVPKKQLVGALQVLLQTRRLQVARELLNAAVLVKEMEAFRVKITAAANETFEAWRERDHDDLVLAVALAAWVGEKGIPPQINLAKVAADKRGRTMVRGQ